MNLAEPNKQPSVSIPLLIPPRIIVTPSPDDEQIQHNACIRASLLQRNAFATITQEEKAVPSTAARPIVSLHIPSTTRPFLAPPEEPWAHCLRDTYENRMAYPQYFDILPPARKRPAKIVEKHPAAMVSPTQSVRKRWSIAGSGVGFGFGKDADVRSTLQREPQTTTVAPTVASAAPVAASTLAVVESKPSSDCISFKRRPCVTSTRTLSDKPDKCSRSSPSPPPSRPSPMILTSSSGNAFGKWANSNTGGAFGKGVQGVKSFIWGRGQG